MKGLNESDHKDKSESGVYQSVPALHEKQVHGGFPPDAYSIIYAVCIGMHS
jgi:hypothetical protein